MEVMVESSPVDPTRRSLEVVERKGIGHPDTLCDRAAEAYSRQLSRYYLERAGRILHHNVDKALLVAGQTSVRFGGGEWLAPIFLTLAGRATTQIDDEPVPTRKLAQAAIDETLAPLRYLDPRQVELRVAVRPGGQELLDLFERDLSCSSVPRANDTSIGVGFAPLSEAERLTLEIEQRLVDAGRREPESPVGEDTKVMVIRQGDTLHITLAVAIVACCVADQSAYEIAVERIRHCAESAARGMGFERVEVTVNAADEVGRSVYLTLSGTSAESGDDGQVGRGNRFSGLITPMRPMTIEAYSGKNPCNHVGKLLSMTATRVAERCARLERVRAAECILVSEIGQLITEPRAGGVRLDVSRGLSDALREEVSAIVRSEVAALPGLWKEILSR
jgi:S-adenosylmethionine synthetase